ncbi:MAG: winged helix-turn-helix domain-containing protein, partial [Bacteroidales bacterium]|nr:winged helix-turn-helix domain-containing protein [Bacteroidales bacterium]
MAKENITTEQAQLARFAKALGHPVRVAILQMLAKQTCCSHGDMSEILPVAKSTLSQHLNELKDAGLIQGTITPPTVYYCINPENWVLAKTCPFTWQDTPYYEQLFSFFFSFIVDFIDNRQVFINKKNLKIFIFLN